MTMQKQRENLVLKNALWFILHPFNTVRDCWMWITQQDKPPTSALVNGVVLLNSVAFFGFMGTGWTSSSLGQAIFATCVGVMIWFLIFQLGLAADLKGNLHPWILYFKSVMTGSFWIQVWAVVFHFFIFKGGL